MKVRHQEKRQFVNVIQFQALDGTPVKVKQTERFNHLRVGNNPVITISDAALKVLKRTKNLQAA